MGASPPSTGSCTQEILFRCENFLCYTRNENISPRPPPPQLEAIKKKFSLDVKISCVIQETKIFHQGLPPQLEAVKKKFSLDVKTSCVMQETKIFHQGPPLNWKILVRKRFKEEILFRCEHFLCYTRNEIISPRPPPPQLEDVKKKFSLDVKISCVMQETKIFHQGLPPL